MTTALTDGLAIPPPTLLSGDIGAILSVSPPTLLSGDVGAILVVKPPTLTIGTVIMDGGVLSIPAVTLAATGFAGSYNTADTLLAPAPTLIAAASSPGVITVVNTVPLIALIAAGIMSTPASAALIVPAPTSVITGFTGIAVSAVLAAPAPTISVGGYPTNVISFAGVVPIPQITSYATFPVNVAFRTWVLNTRRLALTEYGSEFAFNSYTIFQGQVLACGSSGVVALGTQSTDNGTAIDARFRTGKSNYGSSYHKRVPRIYADIATDGDLIFRSITNEGGVRSYLLPYNNVVGIQSRRVPVGKGPRSTYFQYEVENVAGSDLTVPSLLAYPVKLRRRIS